MALHLILTGNKPLSPSLPAAVDNSMVTRTWCNFMWGSRSFTWKVFGTSCRPRKTPLTNVRTFAAMLSAPVFGIQLIRCVFLFNEGPPK